jgi:hypothetical protein
LQSLWRFLAGLLGIFLKVPRKLPEISLTIARRLVEISVRTLRTIWHHFEIPIGSASDPLDPVK